MKKLENGALASEHAELPSVLIWKTSNMQGVLDIRGSKIFRPCSSWASPPKTARAHKCPALAPGFLKHAGARTRPGPEPPRFKKHRCLFQKGIYMILHRAVWNRRTRRWKVLRHSHSLLRSFGTKTLNNCRGMIVFATLRQPLTRSNSRKQRSRGRVASQTKTCCPLEASLEASPGPHARLQKVGKFSSAIPAQDAPHILQYNVLFGIYSGIYFGILSDILSGICSGPCVSSRIGSSP